MKGLGRLHSCDAGASPALLLRMDAVARDPILLVDDEPEVLEVFQEALALAGYGVDTASSALQALELIQTLGNRYSAAVLDFNLPDMDGIVLHREIREVDKELAARTVFISGEIQSNSNLDYYAFYAAYFLHKPLLPGDLVAVLKELLGDAA